jgi:hypothetical protein
LEPQHFGDKNRLTRFANQIEILAPAFWHFQNGTPFAEQYLIGETFTVLPRSVAIVL